MNKITQIILYSFFSGITVFIGGFLSYLAEKFRDTPVKTEVIHMITAFGGGILIAAVAFVLTPKGIKELHLIPLSILFIAGAYTFFFIDRALEKKGGTAAQLLAMMMDYVPEALALGAVFCYDIRLGMLLAIFIGLQNLPEAFNAYRDLRSTHSPRQCLLILLPLSFVGVIAALSGNLLLQNYPTLVAALMVFSAGGIVYLMFQDIAPLSKMKNHWVPALGASFGFMVGMIGKKLFG